MKRIGVGVSPIDSLDLEIAASSRRRERRAAIVRLGIALAASLTLSIALTATAHAAQPSGPSHNRTLSGGTALGVSGFGSVRCESTKGTGAVTGASTGTLTITYSGCKLEGFGPPRPCRNRGVDEIETNPLVTDLDWISQANNEVGEDYKAEVGNTLGEFECEGGIRIQVNGSMIGTVQILDQMGTRQEVKLTAAGSKQVPEKFETGATDVLTAHVEVGGTTFDKEAVLALTWEIENQAATGAAIRSDRFRRAREDKTEIRTLGKPEHGRCQKAKGGKYINSVCTQAVAPYVTAKKVKGKYEWRPIM